MLFFYLGGLRFFYDLFFFMFFGGLLCGFDFGFFGLGLWGLGFGLMRGLFFYVIFFFGWLESRFIEDFCDFEVVEDWKE